MRGVCDVFVALGFLRVRSMGGVEAVVFFSPEEILRARSGPTSKTEIGHEASSHWSGAHFVQPKVGLYEFGSTL